MKYNYLLGLVVLLFASACTSGDIILMSSDVGWIEYIENTYTDTNRLTIGTSLINFSMTNYSTIETELPGDVNNLSWFNGTHFLTDRQGNSYMYRFDFKAEPQANSVFCEFFYYVGGDTGTIEARLLTFPKGNGIEQLGSFTNVEFTLEDWYTNGAIPQIQCSSNVEFWDIEIYIERLYKGKAIY